MLLVSRLPPGGKATRCSGKAGSNQQSWGHSINTSDAQNWRWSSSSAPRCAVTTGRNDVRTSRDSGHQLASEAEQPTSTQRNRSRPSIRVIDTSRSRTSYGDRNRSPRRWATKIAAVTATGSPCGYDLASLRPVIGQDRIITAAGSASGTGFSPRATCGA